MFKRVFACVAVSVLCSCGGADKVLAPQDSGTRNVPVDTFRLSVTVGEGVSSLITPGVHAFQAGSKVSYQFDSLPGYHNLVVQLNGVLVSRTGQLSISSDAELFANAEKIPVVPAEALPVFEGAKNYMQSRDTLQVLAGYLSFLHLVEDLYAQHSSEQARELALTGYAQAVSEVDEEDFRRTERILAGKLFGRGNSSGVSPAKSQIEKPVTLIFVNGIFNSSDAASVSRAGLEKVVEETGLTSLVETYNFYNPSDVYSHDQFCWMRALGHASYKELIECVGFVADWSEMTRQMNAILNRVPSEAEPEAIELAKVVLQERSVGHSVILVGHSQGTLMVEQALAKLEQKGLDRCVSAISLGGLLGKSSWSPVEPAGFVVAGDLAKDIVLEFGFNDFDRVRTNLSDLADNRLKGLSGVYGLVTKLIEDKNLHNMSGSYLAGDKSRDILHQEIIEAVGALKNNPECGVVPGLSIYASSGRIGAIASFPPSDLWSVPVSTSGVDVKVGRIRTSTGFEPVITDIATPLEGDIWGVSFDKLYQINRGTGLAVERAWFSGSPEINAAALDHDGYLYVVSGRSVVAIDVRASPMRVTWSGDYGLGYVSDGDIAFSPEGLLYGTVVNGEGRRYLANIDLTTGAVSTIGGEQGAYGRIWGLSFVGNTLFGFTSSSDGESGKLIILDPKSGESRFVRNLAFNAFGAGVSLP